MSLLQRVRQYREQRIAAAAAQAEADAHVIDAVVYGSFHDSAQLVPKATRLGLQGNPVAINDGSNDYVRTHQTLDFQSAVPVPREEGIAERVADLSGSPGFVLPYEGGQFSNILENPQIVITRYGGIYFKGGVEDPGIVGLLDKMVDQANQIFSNPGVANNYVIVYGNHQVAHG